MNVLQENIGIPTDARVELTFIHGGKKYILERSVYDMMTDTGEIRRNLEVEVKLLIQNEDGNVESVLTKESDVAKNKRYNQ